MWDGNSLFCRLASMWRFCNYKNFSELEVEYLLVISMTSDFINGGQGQFKVIVLILTSKSCKKSSVRKSFKLCRDQIVSGSLLCSFTAPLKVVGNEKVGGSRRCHMIDIGLGLW